MANKRRLEKKRILEKNKDRLVVYHSTKNNTESIVSESSCGESFISEEKKIVHEENMILPPVSYGKVLVRSQVVRMPSFSS